MGENGFEPGFPHKGEQASPLSQGSRSFFCLHFIHELVHKLCLQNQTS